MKKFGDADNGLTKVGCVSPDNDHPTTGAIMARAVDGVPDSAISFHADCAMALV